MSFIDTEREFIAKRNKSGKKHILVTGGAGYIGSHTVLELLDRNYAVTVLDNFDNSSMIAIDRVRKLSGCPDEDLLVAEADLVDMAKSELVFSLYGPFDACIHFAGLKAVGESVALPLHYYANNITGTLNLIHLLDKYGCRRVVFSSSATVYGDPDTVPITEESALRATNPYGRTKLWLEDIFRDIDKSAPGKWSVALLRYFNPVGAHESGIIGEDPKGAPNNLTPYVTQVAIGRRAELSVFGDDYDTPDGTGVRDYIHVVDLAKGHERAIVKVLENDGLGAQAYNLGTGNGNSVLDIVNTMKKVSGKPIPYKIAPRRPGDIGVCYADPKKAKEELGWTAKFDLEKMLADSWKWQSQNPFGYLTEEESLKMENAPRKCQVFQMLDKNNL